MLTNQIFLQFRIEGIFVICLFILCVTFWHDADFSLHDSSKEFLSYDNFSSINWRFRKGIGDFENQRIGRNKHLHPHSSYPMIIKCGNYQGKGLTLELFTLLKIIAQIPTTRKQISKFREGRALIWTLASAPDYKMLYNSRAHNYLSMQELVMRKSAF